MTKYTFDKEYVLKLSIGKAGADQSVEYYPSEDYTEAEWDEMDDEEKEVFLHGKAEELLEELIEYDFDCY